MAMHQQLAAALSIFAWGVATFAMVPPLQMNVLAAAVDAPRLAASTNIGAFNLGNALGAAAGGGVISLRWGYPAVALTAAAFAACALVLVLAGERFTSNPFDKMQVER
jgi:DHA1 family inner membrane transport protein